MDVVPQPEPVGEVGEVVEPVQSAQEPEVPVRLLSRLRLEVVGVQHAHELPPLPRAEVVLDQVRVLRVLQGCSV